jgi:hypothetical protein
MSHNKILVQPELASQFSYFILEQFAKLYYVSKLKLEDWP